MFLKLTKRGYWSCGGLELQKLPLGGKVAGLVVFTGARWWVDIICSLFRFASNKYSNDSSSVGDVYMHLTNYSINKNSATYSQNEDSSSCQVKGRFHTKVGVSRINCQGFFKF